MFEGSYSPRKSVAPNPTRLLIRGLPLKHFPTPHMPLSIGGLFDHTFGTLRVSLRAQFQARTICA